MKTVSCPQCSSPIEYQDRDKMVRCEYCHSSMVIETVINIEPLQIPLKSKIVIQQQCYQVKSINQWNHAQGVRTEYLLVDRQNHEYILSKDDENVSLVKTVKLDKMDRSIALEWNSLEPNTQLNINGFEWLVTEKRKMSGYSNLPYYYSYLTSKNAELLVLIFLGLTEDSLTEIRQGYWLSSFDVKIVGP